MSRRNSYMNPKDLVPRSGYVGMPLQEAAKYLRDMATDFLKERSGPTVVDDAIAMWNGARRDAASAPRALEAREPSEAAIEAALEVCPILNDVQQISSTEVQVITPTISQARGAVVRILCAAYAIDGVQAGGEMPS